MIRAPRTSVSGMNGQQTNLGVISNNMANVNTGEFKKMSATFQNLIYQTLGDPGASTSLTTRAPSGFQMGLGVFVSDPYSISTQGGITQTGNQLDVATQEEGFFKVVLPDGTIAYTRNGRFRLDDGRIELARFVNAAGLRCMGNDLFIQTDASGEPIIDNPNNQGSTFQWYLESSNVDIVEEMVNLITAERAFEFNAKGITTADEMLAQGANLNK